MPKRKFKIGDKVLVLRAPSFRSPKGTRDDLGTKKLLKYMVGKVYTVTGFDAYGHVELHPRRLSWVWIEPEFLKLRTRNPGKSRAKRKR